MSKNVLKLPRICIDTREQLAYTFDGHETVRRKLDTGDYSLEGFESRVSVERKSHGDLWQCVTQGRARFERCMKRLGELESAAVVVECTLQEFCVRPSQIQRFTIASAVGSVVSWSCLYRVPIFFAGNRIYAERLTVRWLFAFLKHIAGATKSSIADYEKARQLSSRSVCAEQPGLDTNALRMDGDEAAVHQPQN